MQTRYRERTGAALARLMIFVLSAFLISLPTFASTQSKKPISKSGLLEAVRLNGLSTQELIRQIKQRGVSFQLTPEDESEFRNAGARPELIEAVRANYRPAGPSTPEPRNPRPGAPPRDPVPPGPPLSKDQIVAMLQGGASAARVEQFVEVRGVNFSLTAEITREITAAGGNRSLLGAIAEKVGPRQPKPSGDSKNSAPDYDELTDLAQTAISAGDSVEAVRLLKQALNLSPSQPVAYQLLGIVQLYQLRTPDEAEKSMRAAIERGGEAKFNVYHDHGKLFTTFCEGSFFISKSGVTFKANNDGKDTFEANDIQIKEAKVNKKMFGISPGAKPNPFHIEVIQPTGKTRNYNFAPMTGSGDESNLAIKLIDSYK